jgi:hypothetical protein
MTEYVEYVGYAASFFVLLSFLMKRMLQLRLVNIVGCLFFIAYGFLLPDISWPIIITNAAIVSVNLFYLLRTKKEA